MDKKEEVMALRRKAEAMKALADFAVYMKTSDLPITQKELDALKTLQKWGMNEQKT